MEEQRWRRRSVDVATVVGLLVVTRIGFASWYSASLLDRSAFVAQYRHGVYRHRVVGREVVLWIERLVGDPLGDHLVIAGRRPLAGGMATAGLLVDVAAAVAIALLVGWMLDRRAIGEPSRSLVIVTFGLLVAMSAIVVTPYDLLSVALLLAALVASELRRPWDLGAVALVALGVATRESVLVAVAAMVAVRWVDGAHRRSDRRRDVVLVATALAGIGTYVASVVLAGGEDGTLWAQLSLRGNLGRLYGWLGLGAMVGGWSLWRRACRFAGLDDARARRVVAWTWACSSPYLVVALLTGYWFEVRLLLPLVAAEVWVRTVAAAVPRHRAPHAGPP